jgi:hypothetical protein
VIIAIAIALHAFNAPGLLKAALLSLLAGVATFSLSAWVFRRIPLLRRIV